MNTLHFISVVSLLKRLCQASPSIILGLSPLLYAEAKAVKQKFSPREFVCFAEVVLYVMLGIFSI